MIKADNISRKPFLGSTEIGEVWLGNIKIYPDTPTPPTPSYDTQYLTFEALENGTFQFSNNVDYSVDGGTTWTTLSANTNTPTIANGSRIMWKGLLIPNSTDGIGKFTSTGRFNVEGNPMSLLFGNNFIGQTDLTGYDYAFYNLYKNAKVINAQNIALPATTLAADCYHSMFQGCANLTNVLSILPATTMVQNCYYGMFAGCLRLTNAPTLPATTLAERCYQNMFASCRVLTTAPVLPATTLADYCYNAMFKECNSLVTAPALPSTTLAQYCYYNMFDSCTSLTTAPVLPATTLLNGCYSEMFQYCSSLNHITCLATNISAFNCTNGWVYNVAASGTFTKAASMTDWTTDNNGIPSGWTVVSNS